MLSFILLIVYIYRYVAMEHERQNVAVDLEDDVGSVFARIDAWLMEQRQADGLVGADGVVADDELMEQRQADGVDGADGVVAGEWADRADSDVVDEQVEQMMGWHMDVELLVVDEQEVVDEPENDAWFNDILWAGPQNNFNDDDMYAYADYDSGVDMHEGSVIDWNGMVEMDEEDWELGDG